MKNVLILLFVSLTLCFLSACTSKPKSSAFKSDFHKEIKLTIKDNQSKILNCYSEYLKVKPNAQGKMMIEWAILDRGTVSEIRIKENPFEDETVFNCIASDMKNWKFPKPAEGKEAIVSFPFLFNIRN